MGESHPTLARNVGFFGAILLGLGSIVGAGVFVTLGLGAGAAGPSVLFAITLAAGVAICNGLSSAQLAAAHPVSGGTYEYGYRWLTPQLGFVAGWMFLLAKSASAATAALGFAGYFNRIFGLAIAPAPLACGAVCLVTVIVLGGIKRTNLVNLLIVSMTFASLIAFAIACFPAVERSNYQPLTPRDSLGWRGLLEATALVFVAFTGYGRVATLGEEVENPRQVIPRAVVATLLVSMLLYLLVAIAAIGVAGAEDYAELARRTAAPLEVIAGRVSLPLAGVISVAAMVALLGVLLNLILGLSRVLLAMGRRRDMPALFAHISARQSPTPAILGVAVLVAGLTWLGDVKTTWSFSAFTVLVYYSLTNLCALQLKPEERLFPKLPAYLGLLACATLAFWVEWKVWLIGLAVLAMGLIGRQLLSGRRETQK